MALFALKDMDNALDIVQDAMLDFVRQLEALLGRPAQLELLPPLATEMPETCADLTRIRAAVGYEPKVSLEEGLRRFVDWFRAYRAGQRALSCKGEVLIRDRYLFSYSGIQKIGICPCFLL